MKLQASELPVGKPQTRKKTSKLAPLLIPLTLLFTIISLYYPSLFYNISRPKKTNDATSSFDSLQESINPVSTSLSDQKNDHPTEFVMTVTPKETRADHLEMPKSPKEEEEEESSLDKKSDQRRNREHVGSTRKRSARREKKRSGGGGRRPQRDSANVVKEGEKPVRKSGDGGVNKSKEEGCDLFSGEWVPNPEAPYYTNWTCREIQEHQNCMKFGRPDEGFFKWRWKPDGCELPLFDPQQFLQLLRGKSIAFVGDSVARNHMQSLICLLSQVVYPDDLSSTYDQNRRWVYKDYNFNISMFWAPYLVRSEKTDPNDVTKPFNLYLDEFDEDWRTHIETYDYVIISAGHWFFRPTMFYLQRRLVGCLYCQHENVTHYFTSYFSYRRAFRTAFRAINSLENFKGVIFLRTFAPSHFEGAVWDKGGDCVRTSPFKRNEKVLDDYNLEMYTIQLQELRIAHKEGKRKGLRFRLFDATQSMLLRPDGHPSKYGHWQTPNVKTVNDCVHWCLPGPIDTWNDFLLELFKREESNISFS